MFKKTGIIIVAVALLAGTVGAKGIGTSFGSFTTARATGQGIGSLGGGVGLADAKSVIGWFDYGMSKYSNGRIKLGLVDADGADTELAFGADYRYHLLTVNSEPGGPPFDLAIGGLMEFADFGSVSTLSFGGLVIGSHPFTMTNGSVLSPYARFNIRLEKTSWDNKIAKDESDLRFGFNGGVGWEMSKSINLYGEFQFDGNDGLFFGIDFKVM